MKEVSGQVYTKHLKTSVGGCAAKPNQRRVAKGYGVPHSHVPAVTNSLNHFYLIPFSFQERLPQNSCVLSLIRLHLIINTVTNISVVFLRI